MFVMPNPWDRGSALQLEKLGFKALATTSAGLGRSIGKDDQQVTRPELIQHVAELTEVLTVPLSVDSERLYPGDAGGIAVTVRMLADAGAAGCSIEDYDPESGSSARSVHRSMFSPTHRAPPSTASPRWVFSGSPPAARSTTRREGP